MSHEPPPPGAIYRYEVPVDDMWHDISGCSTPLYVACRIPHVVEFWAWHRDALSTRSFRAYGTGQYIPDEATHRGTAIAPGGRLVWHLMERL